MSKKNYVYETQIKRAKRIRPVNAVLLGGLVLFTSMGILGGSVGIKKSQTIKDIRADFINNNQSYQEYMAEREHMLEDKYNSGEITFEEYLNRKNINSRNDNIDSAIDLMADEKQKQEYKDALESKSEAVSHAVMGAFGVVSTGLVTGVSVFLDGMTESYRKIVKKRKYEDEMEK